MQSEQYLRQILIIRNELLAYFDKAKKTELRIAIIGTLDAMIQPQNVNDGEKASFVKVFWQEVPDIYKKAQKWHGQSDELKEVSLHLMVSILVNSSTDFFTKTFDTFIANDLCPKAKCRPYAYRNILQLLTGRFYYDSAANAKSVFEDTFVVGSHFESLTRHCKDQSAAIVHSRLNTLIDLVFLVRKEAIPIEFHNTSVDIVLQIAAHRMSIGYQLIMTLLDTARADSGLGSCYIGIKAARTILDPKSGFQANAFSRKDSDFGILLNDLPGALAPFITAIYQILDANVGPGILGVDTIMLDEIMFPKENQADSGDFYGQSSQILGKLHGLVDNTHNADEESGGAKQNIVSKWHKLETAMMKRPSLALAQLGSSSAPSPGSVASPRTTARLISGISELDKTTSDSNAIIYTALWRCFSDLLKVPKDFEKYMTPSPLRDKRSAKSAKKQVIPPKIKSDQKLCLKILAELFKIMQFVPAAELVGGTFFIGAYLNHSNRALAIGAMNSFNEIYKSFPVLRIGYLLALI